jgi:subtilase family serine protease
MMFPSMVRSLRLLPVILGLALALPQAHAQRRIDGHVPPAVATLAPKGNLPAETQLHLAIGLPVRDAAGLEAFVRSVSDPTSRNYRQYLTPEQFTERFGPTERDYQAVIDFARANGFTVSTTHPNRMIVDVEAGTAAVERAFHVTMGTFKHPTEDRDFYAPENEPVIDPALPILHIGGLDNYFTRKPHHKIRPLNEITNVSPRTGSGPSGTYRGNDFRAAYVPGVSQTGSGQVVGLLEFDGYISSDITNYESGAGISPVTLQNVLIDGYSGSAGSGQSEVCLDIEVAVSMAPGLSKVIVYEAPNPSPWEDILNRMANDNASKNLSCSWGGGGPDSTAEQIFQQMAAQGQSFYNATGDSDAYTGSIPFPSDSPNIIQVGGTTLSTVSAGGAWSSETTWNWGSGTGSSGGISTVYGIPLWQQPISMASNQGSTTKRNLPDVALTADNVYVVYHNGRTGAFGGTSCAAPLWAGYTALINQKALSLGQNPVGFINPAIYAIALGGSYTSNFHDITTGNNITSQSGGKWSAVTGFDLCTGLGTPNGPTLLATLTSSGGGGTNYTISVSASPSSGGTVSGGGSYSSGSSVTVTASANSGYVFTNWTEGGNVVSSSTSYTFTASANRSLVANFSQSAQSYTITVKASPRSYGTVSGGGTFASGSNRTVTATPNSGYQFVNWTQNGSVVSTSASYSFTVTGNRTLVANFVQTSGSFTISVSAAPARGGSVSGGGTFAGGTSHTVTATPTGNFHFVNWTQNGSVVSTSASYTFTLSANRTLVGNFHK